MKRTLAYALAAALLAACTTQEKDFQTSVQDEAVFYASFEQPTEPSTKVYANEDLLLRWTADDRVSIFNKNTYNQEYRFIGETGDYEGGFNKVGDPEFITGDAIPHVVSVYPFRRLTRVTEDETVHVTLPSDQSYAENSFGLGDNTTVSVSSGNLLKYRNVGGYLMLKLYGKGESVSSITLKGNNGEKLAGNATVSMPVDGDPSVSMASDASTEITLTCETPVQLGATAEEATQFWFVVPPVTFSKGFTVTVSGKGGVFEKSTEKTVTIERNKLSKMSPIAVNLSQPKNVIYYTSVDGNAVTPVSSAFWGAIIISNEYADGMGIITFDREVTRIGGLAFYHCTSLSSITIPDCVASIGNNAFSGCTSLTNITVPEVVTNIGEGAFYGCTSLTNITIPGGVTSIERATFGECTSLSTITIPDSVTSIEKEGFYYCTSLPSITIPESVTSIGEYAFYNCTSLNSITIPESVTSIGEYTFSNCMSLSCITFSEGVTSIGDGAFAGCSNLPNITIPEGVTSIGNDVFAGCSNLPSITIPEGVTSIGNGAFAGCSNLPNITIPEGVTSIGEKAFYNCTSLGSITIPEGVTSIERATFGFCTSLISITIPENVTSVGEDAFYNCTSLRSITIPDCVASIGNNAFSYCTSLTNITVPKGVTSIEEYSFSNCTSLSSITVLPTTPPVGNSYMFSDTNNAPIYVPAGSVAAYKSAEFWSDYADRIYAIGTPMAVDLGLSVNWASFNLGATKPEEYGDYYAWGETEPYYSNLDPLIWRTGKENGYNWTSYKWCMGSSNTLTKYCSRSYCGYEGYTDTKTELDPQDDAAHVNLGGNWRVPTDEEWSELMDNCTWTWTNKNGVVGYLVTADNGNIIFLPAAGVRFNAGLLDVGSYGSYWCSSLHTDNPCNAFSMFFSSSNVYRGNPDRRYGFPVRPVTE